MFIFLKSFVSYFTLLVKYVKITANNSKLQNYNTRQKAAMTENGHMLTYETSHENSSKKLELT